VPTEEAATDSVSECPVCLQPCVFPVQLPCLHVFCYLCVKGVAGRNRRCALCRADIPQDFVRRPVLVGKDAVTDQLDDQQHGECCWMKNLPVAYLQTVCDIVEEPKHQLVWSSNIMTTWCTDNQNETDESVIIILYGWLYTPLIQWHRFFPCSTFGTLDERGKSRHK